MTKSAAVLAIALSLCSCASGAATPFARDGLLDLRDWNFAERGSVELRGDWEFYFGELILPDEFKTRGPATAFIGCPSFWKGAQTGNGPAGAFGIATYRLKLLLPATAQKLGLRIGDISGASRIFANGDLVAASGRIGESARDVVPDYRPQYFQVEAGGSLELVIHEANFEDSFGGRLWYPGNIGMATQIQDLRARNIILDSFVAGLIFIIAVFFFVIFLYRRFDASAIVFASMCLGMCVYQASTGEHISVFIIQSVSSNALFHVRRVILACLPPLYTMLFAMVFPEKSARAMVKIIVIAGSIFAALGIMLPLRELTSTLPLFHIYASATLLYILVLLVRAWIRRREGAVIFTIGLGLFMIATINDTLVVDLNLRSIFLLPIGQAGFIFSWAVALSTRFARDYQRAESLGEWNNRLRELDEAKTNFFANSSHELRTPITLLATPLDGIISGRYGESLDKSHPIFGIMKRNADRIKRLADGLLDFLKVDSGSVTASPLVIDLRSFADAYVAEFAPVAERRGLSLAFRGEAPANASVDPALLETVLLNLLSNAVKFTPPGGSILVEVAARDEVAIISVTDSGIGIERERIPRLFERFASSSEKSRSDYSGFGIGLPLAAGLVKLMGGRIEVESEPGAGSVFRVVFQRRPDRAAPAPEPSRARIASYAPAALPEAIEAGHRRGSGAPPILVVDDDRDMGAFLAASLAGRFEVAVAYSGPEALCKLDSGFAPRAILCDVMMPGMDGLELKRAIDETERCRGLPFLFLSAKADERTRLEGLSAGAVDYIVKPFSLQELEAKLEALISASDSLRAHLESRVVGALREGPAAPGHADWRARAARFELGPRDLEIIALLLEGMSDKEIADSLACASHTVSNRVSAILKRTGSSSRTALIALMTRA